ncbi:hypothetical protein BBK36DRAFT_1108685 [Trichoderma citrinoviride]|uniref:Uncharacterized protein n=1 Tax=Trichoderma citrinoviride TaxID=58853 RepID=A0A2T4BNF2_9HYPO|nr:hypothetical protein BBK36DRAFT_1108685 [Trichoderma citrinoviride]PTB70848.1 hypothetical protein BBK36DRAFT_1108685 [Trichoderma citrinoviride]
MNSTTLTCPVTGNPDLYGLGIRIGIYIQMLTVQLSGLASAILRTEDSLGQGTIIFVLATGIVLIRLLRAATDIQPVEVFPILTLLLAQVGVCRVPYWKGQTTALIYAVEVAGLIALFAWYWWHGMDTLPRKCHDDKAFFFAKVSIWHWFRTLNKVGSVFAIIGGVVSVLFYLGAIILFTFVRAANFVRRFRGETGGGGSKEEDNPMGYGPLDFLVNVGAIVYVEMALKWNDISGVHSLAAPGQFMPFFISIAQLLSVFYGIGKAAMAMAGEEESLSDAEFGELCPFVSTWWRITVLTELLLDEGDLPCPHEEKGWLWSYRSQHDSLPLVVQTNGK